MNCSDRDMQELLGHVLPAVADQLRVPLGNVYGAVSALFPPEVRELSEKNDVNAAILYQGYYRLLRMVNNLSAVSVLKDSSVFIKKNLELVQWLHEICLVAEPLLREKGITLNYRCEMNAHVVGVETHYLETLVWNLLSNAAKYTPCGGEVTVTLRQKTPYVYLSVSDTGCGMTAEEKERAFGGYVDADLSLNHGIGLGLTLCRRIAEGHGGRLLLESVKDKGTCVTVCLPDERSNVPEIHDCAVDYTGGFEPHFMGLADALDYKSFLRRNMD